jgi:hypothetical protein
MRECLALGCTPLFVTFALRVAGVVGIAVVTAFSVQTMVRTDNAIDNAIDNLLYSQFAFIVHSQIQKT